MFRGPSGIPGSSPQARVAYVRGRDGSWWPVTDLVRGDCEDHLLPSSDGGMAWESEMYPSRFAPQAPSGSVGLRGTEVGVPAGDRVFDFASGINKDPFYITKTYGPAAPWPADRPATWITKPYGPAADAPLYRPDAAILIPPPGAPAFSRLSVTPSLYDGELRAPGNLDAPYPGPPRPGLGGDAAAWFGKMAEGTGEFLKKNPPAVYIALIGGILLAIRLTSALKA